MTGLEPVRAVRARYGRLQADAVCECGACLAAQCDEPPILVPDHRERDAAGVWHDVGRWEHGYKLAKLIRAKRLLAVRAAAVRDRRPA